MRALAFETSGRTGSIALVGRDGNQAPQVERHIALPEKQRTAQCLAPAVADLLADARQRLEDLDVICVASGPGSFTGLRIGVTLAKTLAYVARVPLVGVPTLLAMSAGHSDRQRLWTVLDAQRNQLFVACFEDAEAAVSQRNPTARLCDVQQWLADLRPGETVVGPPIEKLRSQLPAGVIAETSPPRPNAADVGLVGIEFFRRGQTVDPLQLVPDYGRKSAAEEKREQMDRLDARLRKDSDSA